MSDVLGVRQRPDLQGEVASLADAYAAKMMDALAESKDPQEAEFALAGAFLAFLAESVLLIQSLS